MNIQKITRPIVLIALFLIPLFPLIVANSWFFPFITGKAYYFRILVEVAFAGWALLAFVDAKYRPKLSPLMIGVTLFAVITLIADLLGVNPIRSLWSNFERSEGWITVIHLWMFFMVTSVFFGSHEKSKNLLHHWLHISTFIAFIVAIYGLVQWSGHATIHQSASRLDASLGNAAYLAVYMLFHVGIAAYLFFVARSRKIANYAFLQWVYGIVAVICAFVLFETATRGTILGLIGAVMLSLFLYAVFARKESKKSRYISAGIILAIILLGLGFWMNRPDHFTKKGLPLNSIATFIQGHEVLNRLAGISLDDMNGQARQYIWPMALKGAMQRPLFGWGQENFNYIFNKNYDARMWGQEQWFDRAHSVFLDWLVASGIIGLISYLALYVLFIFAVWKSTATTAEKSVLTGLIAGYAVHNIFVFDNLASYVMFFILLTLAYGLKDRSGEKVLFGTSVMSKDAGEYIVAPVVIVLLVAGIYFLNVRPIQANTSLISALQACNDPAKADVTLFESTLAINAYVANQETREQFLSCAAQILTNQQVPGPTKQAFFSLAMKEVQAQIAATPQDARIYVLAGSFYNQINQLQQAQSLLEKAHSLSPAKQSIDFQLATDYMNGGKTEQGLALLKQAYESDTTYVDAQIAYAMGLIIAGKEKDARAFFHDDPAIFENPRMAQIYVSLKQYDKAIEIFKKLVAANPTDINTKAQLAQIQFTAGLKADGTATLKSLEADHPEYTQQIEAAIKQMSK